MDTRRIVWIYYTNWRGERGWREILPGRIEFENSEYHPDTQHVLYATDVAKHAERTFAMKDIHEWRTSPSNPLGGKEIATERSDGAGTDNGRASWRDHR